LAAIHHRRLRDQITDRIRDEILCGKLGEGEPLRETRLAEQYRVSRGPIRDAILQLANEGLVEAEPNRGARVSRVWNADVRPVMVKIRLDLESFALRQMLSRGAKLDLSPLRENLRHFELACRDKDLPAVVRLDMEFHRLILRAAEQPGIESVWLPVMGGMRLPYSRHKTLLESYAEHKAIVAAIESRRIRAALAALKANIH
jgi:DNA-binding GntR family transcriptional regulator